MMSLKQKRPGARRTPEYVPKCDRQSLAGNFMIAGVRSIFNTKITFMEKDSLTLWQESLSPAVAETAVVLFSSYHNIPSFC